MIIAIATPEEYRLLPELVPEHILKESQVVLTGVGAMNVIRALDKLDRKYTIINVGYAGSNVLEVGKAYQVSTSCLYHPIADYGEPNVSLSLLDDKQTAYPCYTSSDFVTNTDIKQVAIFDMELAIIAAMGFERVYSIKKISDNLSLKEYEEGVKK